MRRVVGLALLIAATFAQTVVASDDRAGGEGTGITPSTSNCRGLQRVSGENPVLLENGKVVARAMIDEDGNVGDVTIVKAEPPQRLAGRQWH